MSAQAQVDFDKIKIEGALRAAFDSFASWNSSFAISEEAELPRFRGSAIPHCPIHVAIDHTRSDHRLEERGFMLDYASEHGKLVHALTQKWLGIVGLMYGRWKCSKCGADLPQEGSDVPGLLGPVYHCNTPCEYVEYDIDAPHIGYTGHCDGILKIVGKYLPIEMKIRKAEVIAKVNTSGPYSVDNITQATSYRWCLPSILGVPESDFHDYVGLLYFDRADVRKRALSVYPYTPKIFEDEIRAFRRTGKIIELKVYNRLRGICTTSQDRKFCPYHDVCFSTSPRRQLEQYLPGINKPILPEDIPQEYRRGK